MQVKNILDEDGKIKLDYNGFSMASVHAASRYAARGPKNGWYWYGKTWSGLENPGSTIFWLQN